MQSACCSYAAVVCKVIEAFEASQIAKLNLNNISDPQARARLRLAARRRAPRGAWLTMDDQRITGDVEYRGCCLKWRHQSNLTNMTMDREDGAPNPSPWTMMWCFPTPWKVRMKGQDTEAKAARYLCVVDSGDADDFCEGDHKYVSCCLKLCAAENHVSSPSCSFSCCGRDLTPNDGDDIDMDEICCCGDEAPSICKFALSYAACFPCWIAHNISIHSLAYIPPLCECITCASCCCIADDGSLIDGQSITLSASTPLAALSLMFADEAAPV